MSRKQTVNPVFITMGDCIYFHGDGLREAGPGRAGTGQAGCNIHARSTAVLL